MDIFSTAVTSCQIIYQILEASAAFPEESRSLAARFKYDARILQHFCDYLNDQGGGPSGLTNGDKQLLEESTAYLGSLLTKVEGCRAKLEAQSRWSKEVNRLGWRFRRSDLIELEKELYEWTQRLDLSLIALPEKVRSVINLEDDEAESQLLAPKLAIQSRIERYGAMARKAKKGVWERLIIEKHESRLVLQAPVSRGHYIGCEFDGAPALIEYKLCPPHLIHDKDAVEILREEVGEFAAALNCLDPTTTAIPRCIGLFDETQPLPRFGLVHELPSTAGQNPISFRDLLNAKTSSGGRQKLVYTLNQRFEFARKLASAIFFLHAVGWVHKAVRPQNILLLQKRSSGSKSQHPSSPLRWNLSSPYLVGFDTARSNEGATAPGSRESLPMHVQIYTHPDRLDAGDYVRYSMAHDVYSLGVVLVELGNWSSLESRPEFRDQLDSSEIAAVVRGLANETELLMGKKYRDVVRLCLTQETEGSSGSVRIIAEVLEKLEDLAQSI